MDPKSKRGTTSADVRRQQFETARKLLFGTERVPGTERERWTTAGKLSPQFKTDGLENPTFTLGPYDFGLRYTYDGRLQGMLNGMHVFTIEDSRLIVKFPRLSKVANLNCNTMKEMPQPQQPGAWYPTRNRKRDFFAHHGRVCYNVGFTKDVNTSFGGFAAYAPVGIAPNDIPALTAYYNAHKNTSHVDVEFYMYVLNKNDTETEIPLLKVAWDQIPREGVVQYPEKRMTCIFNRGIIGLQFCASGELDWSPIPPMFPAVATVGAPAICEFDEGEFWYHSDLVTICDAAAWLMHVLTGPDPRNYDAPPGDVGRRPWRKDDKESSAPRAQPWFTFEQDADGMYHMRGPMRRGNFSLTFFQYDLRPGLDIVQATVIRDTVLNWLQTASAAGFVNSLSGFTRGLLDGGKSDAFATLGGVQAPHTRAEFDAAIARLTRYEQYEYLGSPIPTAGGDGGRSGTRCASCASPAVVGQCTGCGTVAYCGSACQQTHWHTSHKAVCAVNFE